MAVILQRIVGARRDSRFYPDFSGVARSHNFYPSPPTSASDGIVAVALGMGRAIVEGGVVPALLPPLPAQRAAVLVCRGRARDDAARVLGAAARRRGPERRDDARVGLRPRQLAEADGALAAMASTYSPENDAVYDGLSRPGPRLVTFAPMLKQGLFPLAEIVGDADGGRASAGWARRSRSSSR